MITLKPSKYYLYYHIIPNTNNIFYIGIGRASRPFEFRDRKRNIKWVKQFNYTGVSVEIVKEFDNRKDAEVAEIEHIQIAKKDGHILTNLTDGGSGMLGISPWNKGKVNVFSKETREKLSLGNKKRYSTDEARLQHAKKCGSIKEFIVFNVETNEIVWCGVSQSDCARKLSVRQGSISKCL